MAKYAPQMSTKRPRLCLLLQCIMELRILWPLDHLSYFTALSRRDSQQIGDRVSNAYCAEEDK